MSVAREFAQIKLRTLAISRSWVVDQGPRTRGQHGSNIKHIQGVPYSSVYIDIIEHPAREEWRNKNKSFGCAIKRVRPG